MERELLKEARIHGDKMFPFGFYTMNKIYQQCRLEYHWHDELEFLYVMEGCADFQVGTVHYSVSQGEALFINSGILHAGYPIESAECTYCALVFDADLLAGNDFDILRVKFLEPVIDGRYRLPVHIREDSGWEKGILEQIRKAIDTASARQFTYEFLLKAQLYTIFSLLLVNNSTRLPGRELTAGDLKTEKIKEVIKYIRDNYSKKLTIGELAARLSMSEAYFCRFFKQILRKTPIDYINDCRISMAARLLEDKSKKIIEVAMDVGFDNCSYFINLFKNRMKCTPSEYRKNLV